jgi:hypothetical protein
MAGLVPGLVPAIHVVQPNRSLQLQYCWLGPSIWPRPSQTTKTAGTSPAMTENDMEISGLLRVARNDGPEIPHLSRVKPS